MSFLDLIYPKRCAGCSAYGAYLCANCFSCVKFADGGFCSVCQRPAIGGLTHPACKTSYKIDGIFASVLYEGVVKKLIHKFKYKPFIYNLRGTITELFYEGIIQNETFHENFRGEILFVPVPLYVSRMRQRGFNQSMELAKGLAEKFNNHDAGSGDIAKRSIYVVDLLKRLFDTRPQFGLNRQERKDNVKGAFRLIDRTAEDIVFGKRVFLIDDIVTTGATLSSAAKVLKKVGFTKVYGLVFAHGE